MSVVMSSKFMNAALHIFLESLAPLPSMFPRCPIHFNFMNKFSFSQVLNFLNFGSQWFLWFLSHGLSGSGKEKSPPISDVHAVALTRAQFSETEVSEFPQLLYNDQNKTKQAAAF